MEGLFWRPPQWELIEVKVSPPLIAEIRLFAFVDSVDLTFALEHAKAVFLFDVSKATCVATFLLFLETLVQFWQCAMDHCHTVVFSPLPEFRRHAVILSLQAHSIMPSINVISSIMFFTRVPFNDTPASLLYCHGSGLSVHSSSSGKVQAKRLCLICLNNVTPPTPILIRYLNLQFCAQKYSSFFFCSS